MSRAAGAASLELREVRLGLGGRRLIGPLSFTVAPGEITTVMGPSGCGKSSLLAFICGTLHAVFETEGDVLLGHASLAALPPEQRRIGILFQDDLLFPHLSVADNLAFGLPRALRETAARRRRIEAALADADLVGFGERDPATLSGGQRARVALLRTLLSEPRALLLDEPFNKLDVALRDRFRRFVFDHARDRGLATLMVTHDPADAEAAGGAVVEIAAGGTDSREPADREALPAGEEAPVGTRPARATG